MWLPKDERRLIRYYYNEISKINDAQMCKIFTLEDLTKALGKKERPQAQKTLIEDYSEVEALNTLLSKRGLITWEEYKADGNVKLTISLYADSTDNPHLNRTLKYQITLTIAGSDLGKKYSSKLSTFYLWCEEHKLILTIIGLILTLLIVIFTGISAFKNK